MGNIILENKTIRFEIDSEKGTITGISSVLTGWKIFDRPNLGLSFKLMVPIPGKRNNEVLGEKQKPNSVIENDGKAAIKWNGVESEHGGRLEINIEMTIEMNERQAVFGIEIENNSEFIVENVYCPYFGDVQHAEGDKSFKMITNIYAGMQEFPIWPTYKNSNGYHGVDYPTQFNAWGGATPNSPFALFTGGNEGLYAGVFEQSREQLVAWHTELRPGYGSSIDFCVPETSEISGKAVQTRLAAVQVPYIMQGETRKLVSIAFEAFEGGWQKGVDIYKNWRDNTIKMKTAEAPEWAKEPHSWHQVHINSPEDELRIKFKDLPKLGEDCAKHGVKAIQLVGWNDGGQDQGNPSHDPDPRLGTADELRDAIKKIQEMGVKMILFTKFVWADRASQRFRDELKELAVKDPYGDYYMHGGYQYQTASQLLDISTKRLIPMCFLSERYLEICNEEFEKVVGYGADGMLYDECCHHNPTLLCHDTTHGHRYGASVYQNDGLIIENFRKLLPESKKDFLMAGEACYDWQFEQYHLSYHRSENKEHVPMTRYMLPQVQLMTAVTGFDDRNMINQCLMYKYIISYEPYNFKGMLDDYPLTMEYGKKMDALRTELREYFWDGEFRHEQGVVIKYENGEFHRPYGVFKAENGNLGVVICNYEDEEIKVFTDCVSAKYRLVDGGGWIDADDGIEIPSRSAAVVIKREIS